MIQNIYSALQSESDFNTKQNIVFWRGDLSRIHSSKILFFLDQSNVLSFYKQMQEIGPRFNMYVHSKLLHSLSRQFDFQYISLLNQLEYDEHDHRFYYEGLSSSLPFPSADLQYALWSPF